MADEWAGEDDEFFAEIGEIGDPRLARPLSLPSLRLPPTRDALRALQMRDAVRVGAVCALVLLTLLGLLSVLPAQLLPNQSGGKPADHTSPARPPAADAFYLVPGVPWGVVRLDGKPLSGTYTQDTSHPLVLSPGRHTLEWVAQPFLPLRCTITVPADRGDTCPLWHSTDPSSEPYSVVTLHQSLDALAPKQRQALLAATQSALNASSATVTLHPGDHYYAATSGQGGEALATQQLLFGSVSYRLELDGSASEPCDAAPAEQPCRFDGQNCLRFCTLPGSSLASGGRAWMAAVDVHAAWDYTALDGAQVATQVAEPGPEASLLVLRITWSGSGWHVVPIFGNQSGTPVTDDTTCASARHWLFADPEINFFIPDGPFEPIYASGPSPADGCVAVVSTPPGPHGTPSSGAALYLERCGALVAVNAAAHELWPQLPLAGPTERALARELAAYVRGTALAAITP